LQGRRRPPRGRVIAGLKRKLSRISRATERFTRQQTPDGRGGGGGGAGGGGGLLYVVPKRGHSLKRVDRYLTKTKEERSAASPGSDSLEREVGNAFREKTRLGGNTVLEEVAGLSHEDWGPGAIGLSRFDWKGRKSCRIG